MASCDVVEVEGKVTEGPATRNAQGTAWYGGRACDAPPKRERRTEQSAGAAVGRKIETKRKQQAQANPRQRRRRNTAPAHPTKESRRNEEAEGGESRREERGEEEEEEEDADAAATVKRGCQWTAASGGVHGRAAADMHACKHDPGCRW